VEDLQETFSFKESTKKYYVYEAPDSSAVQFKIYLDKETVGLNAPTDVQVTVKEWNS